MQWIRADDAVDSVTTRVMEAMMSKLGGQLMNVDFYDDCCDLLLKIAIDMCEFHFFFFFLFLAIAGGGE